MDQLEDRAATLDDVAAWARLDQRACAFDGRATPWEAEELAEEVDTAWAQLATRSRVLVRPDGELAAVAWLDAPPDSERVYVDIEVDPPERDRLEPELLDWVVALADRERDAGRLPDPAAQLEVVTTPAMAARNALLESRGFHPARHWHTLIRELAEPLEDRDPPDGVAIVGWDPDRSEEVRRVHNTAFRDHWGNREVGPDEWRSLTTGAVARPELHRVAVVDGVVVGYAVVGEHGEGSEEGVHDAWVRDLGTLREWRGRGVASALLVEVMSAMRAAGYTHASLGVDSASPTGATRLYASHGFNQRATLVSWHRPLGAVEPAHPGVAT